MEFAQLFNQTPVVTIIGQVCLNQEAFEEVCRQNQLHAQYYFMGYFGIAMLFKALSWLVTLESIEMSDDWRARLYRAFSILEIFFIIVFVVAFYFVKKGG